MGELDFLDDLYIYVKDAYRDDVHESIFKEISSQYYHENYHSDILAYYFKDNMVKKELILWLNKRRNLGIKYEDYYDGQIEREENRIDILLYDANKQKAIIIENKSNNATDQPRQLYRYYKSIGKNGVAVDAILYLNLDSDKEPDLTGLSEEQKCEITKLLVVRKLVGDSESFVENVVNNVILNTGNIRLNALSHEIKGLFCHIGGMTMKNINDFLAELSKGDNLGKLTAINEYFYKFHELLAEKYFAHISGIIEQRQMKHKISRIWFYKKNYLAIDFFENEINYAVDIIFHRHKIDFQILVRNKPDELLERLKERVGGKFPFKEKTEDRYVTTVDNPLDSDAVEGVIEKILTFIETV